MMNDKANGNLRQRRAMIKINKETLTLIFKILFIGALSGFPQVLIGSLLSLWLKAAGMSKAEIGAFGAILIFYTFNWVFAPLLDKYSAFGIERRRFWLLLTQIAILIACINMAIFGVQTHLFIWMALLIAFASSLQDVAIDALRIEMIPPERNDLLALSAAAAVTGWYGGFNLGGWLGLHIFAHLQQTGANSQPIAPQDVDIWATTYGALAVLWLLLIFITPRLLARQRRYFNRVQTSEHEKQPWWQQVFVAPFYDFVRQKGKKLTIYLLLFIFLFKLGDAFLGKMAILFYKEVGFSEREIADYAKIVGLSVIVIFSFVSGVFTARVGIWSALMIGGVAMAATNLLFALLAVVGADVHLLMIAVAADQFTTAFATVAFVTFISALCDRNYTASQYSLLASLGNAARILLASTSGFILERYLHNDWTIFFIMTALMVIPSLILLWLLKPYATIFKGQAATQQ